MTNTNHPLEDSGERGQSFGARVTHALRWVREPLSYALVVIIALGGYFEDRVVQSSAILALGVVMVRLVAGAHRRLDRVHDQIIHLPRQTEYFGDLNQARQKLFDVCKLASSKDKSVDIQYIGMTMYNAWETLERVLDNLEQDGVSNITLHVAMSSPKWLDKKRIRDAWSGDSARLTRDRIEKCQERGWAVKVSKYAHMPCIHGCLINGRYLFFGLAIWEVGGMRAGDRGFEFFSDDGGIASINKIHVFKTWFERCTAVEPRKYSAKAAAGSNGRDS